MKYNRLFVIGNGFDLRYGIKSSYSDFRDFLETTGDRSFTYAIEEACTIDLWKDFEAALGSLREGSLKNDFYGMFAQVNNDSDDFYQEMLAAHDYHLEALRKDFDRDKLVRHFTQWVNQIDISSVCDDGLLADDDKTLYFSFNYTRTLEKAFNVDPSRILHIHGIQGERDLVIGHAPIPNIQFVEEDIAPEYYQESIFERVRVAFVEETEKPVDLLIEDNQWFFDKLSDVTEVFVIGFSFGEVDLPYIRKIENSVSAKCKWYVYSRHGKRRVANYPIVGKVDVMPYPDNNVNEG